MCGIVGVIGSNNVIDVVIDGLKKLEYRGYDSAGILLIENNSFSVFKEQGKILNLESLFQKENKSLSSKIAIGHTRWATHGKPSKNNAHPHSISFVGVVHNGIIENYQEIKQMLILEGVEFLSQTDSEIIPHLIQKNFLKLKDYKESILKTVKELEGSFALAIIFLDNPNQIFVAKKGSPLIIGIGDDQNFIASDYQAIAKYSNKIIILEDNQIGIIGKNNCEIYKFNGNKILPNIRQMKTLNKNIAKGDFPHFMLKEIYEQPNVIAETIETYIDLENYNINLPNFSFNLQDIQKITIIACGTSYYAGLCGKYIIEKFARIPVEVDIASEFRYRDAIFLKNSLIIFISQSGETADSLASLKYCKENNQNSLAIVNVDISSMAEISDAIIKTIAGPEIGVASTKCYIAQIAVLSILAIKVAEIKGTINNDKKISLIKELIHCQEKITEILDDDNVKKISDIAENLKNSKQILFTGRGVSSVSALESSLKMRELSYINAQGIASGELKHGTIAVIDEDTPLIAIGVDTAENSLIDKIISNIEEVCARGAKVTFVSDKKSIKKIKNLIYNSIEIPDIDGIIQESIIPIVATQLLAYFTALKLGNDVDQPRNLAKSVTVE